MIVDFRDGVEILTAFGPDACPIHLLAGTGAHRARRIGRLLRERRQPGWGWGHRHRMARNLLEQYVDGGFDLRVTMVTRQ